MSSILEALKKAEQESTADRGVGTPWPDPLLGHPSYRQRTRRWWVPVGIIVGICVAGVVFWQMRQPAIMHHPESMTAEPLPLTPKTNHPEPPFASGKSRPTVPVPVAGQQPTSAKTVIDASPGEAAEDATASAVRTTTPMAAIPPVQPEARSPDTATPASEPVLASVAESNRRQAESVRTTGQSMASPPNPENVFRSDPRIDLQALVWAPESATRFVVINNRLIKEGGSVDNIVVVRINPDDVLLAEGSDQWHEAFNIR